MDPQYQEEGEPPRRSGARMPVAIGILLLAGVAALMIWLHLTGTPPVSGERAVAGVTLAVPDGAGAALPAAPPPAADRSAAPGRPAETVPAEVALAEVALGDSARDHGTPDQVAAVTGALAAVPDPALVEPGPHGPLPRIGADGRMPWQVYGRPAPPRGAGPRIAIVVGWLGLNRAATERAIDDLPPEVTLAFAPYAFELQEWIDRARAAGHEVLLQVPMEPEGFPADDPGPGTLLVAAEPRENEGRLLWLLSQAAGYAGIASHRGERFTPNAAALEPVLIALRERGLMIFDSRRTARSRIPEVARALSLPVVAAGLDLTSDPGAAAVDAKLVELEALAAEFGAAAASADPDPVTVGRLAEWAAGLAARGVVLVPATALAAPQAGAASR